GAGARDGAGAEGRLHLWEDRYARAARGAADGLGDWTLAAGHAYFSPRLHEILGLADGRLGDSVESLFECFDAEDAASIRSYFRDRFAGRENKFRFEARSRAPAGEPRWFVARGMIVSNGERPARVVGSTHDITDVQEANAKQR